MTEQIDPDFAWRELEAARELQRSLLPEQSPVVHGFQVAGWNQAAAITSGDTFDWLTLPDGRTLITIADAPGHGLAPALLALTYRAYLRSSADLFERLDTLIPRIDGLLLADLPPGQFIGAAVGILDAHRAGLALCCAAHGAALVSRAGSGTVERLDTDRPPLGIGIGIETWTCPDRALHLEPGDALVLITDGFYEWRDSRGKQFGLDRLADALAHHRHLPAVELIDALYRSVVRFADDSHQRDDLTALVVRRGRIPSR